MRGDTSSNNFLSSLGMEDGKSNKADKKSDLSCLRVSQLMNTSATNFSSMWGVHVVSSSLAGNQSQPSSGTNTSPSNSATGIGRICQICGYMARDITNLRKHHYTHTGEKPYACSFCHYKTTQNSNLRSHYKRHHPEHPPPPATANLDQQHDHYS